MSEFESPRPPPLGKFNFWLDLSSNLNGFKTMQYTLQEAYLPSICITKNHHVIGKLQVGTDGLLNPTLNPRIYPVLAF